MKKMLFVVETVPVSWWDCVCVTTERLLVQFPAGNRCVITLGKLFTRSHLCASVTKQYNLVLA